MAERGRAAIWGYGREGRAAFAHLRRTRPGLALTVVADDPVADPPPDATVVTGDAAPETIAAGGFDLIVKSPGISLYRPELARARAAGAIVTSGTNLWLAAHAGPAVVAVTGTKGKSTTALMLTELLRAAGRDAELLGNAGTPALGAAPGHDATVLELSSYQTADLATPPGLAVFTNLHPEHAPWHGGVERYYADKLRLATLDPATPVIANARDPELARRLAGRAGVTWFNAPDGFAETNGALTFAGRPVAVAGAVPPGRHNLSNLAAAAAAARALGLAGVERALDLGAFAPLPHRLQEVALRDGIVAVDDSISTIPQATLAALDHYRGRGIHLFLGGSERDQDYAALAAALADHEVRAAYLLPVTGARIAAALGAAVPAREYPDLAAAVAAACAAVRPGEVLLLSPAAPSFGQFRDYAERGDRFVALCRAGLGAGPAGAP